jgi:hypothetical protein
MRRLEFDSDPTMTGRVLIADHEVPDVFGSEPLLGDYRLFVSDRGGPVGVTSVCNA